MFPMRMRRPAALLAATSLSLSLACSDAALAQSAPSGPSQVGAPPPPPGAAPVSDSAPPPARVGRLAQANGSVSFHRASGSGWEQAVINTPVTTGDAVFAGSGARAELEIANSLVALDSGSELDIATLDDTHFLTSEPQGRVFVDLGQQPEGAVTTLATPRGTVTMQAPGEFEITAGDSQTPTVVTALAGTAQVTAGTLSLTVPAGQAATITGTDQLAGQVGAAPPQDSFLHDMLAQVASAQGGSLPPLVAGMTGCRELAHTGTWHSNPQYGQVWYPPVSSGWVPYRDGRWEYVQPWGWTWIDNEPWGFAPFHYGRWAYVDDRWGWIPGDPAYAEGYEGPEYGGVPEPVYAPALVSWGDFGAGVVAGAVAGGVIGALIGDRDRGPGVGWVPLGPGEPYVPPYARDRRYFDRVNMLNVRNVTRITNIENVYQGRNFGQFANRRAATLMPASALARGEAVRGHAGGFTKAAFAASPIVGRHVLAPPAGGAAHVRPAAGPALNPAFFRPQHLEGGRLPFRGGPGRAGAPGGPGGGAHPAGFAAPGGGPRPGQAGGMVHPAQPGGMAHPGQPGGLPGLRPHEQVVGGRPGAVPDFHGASGAPPGAPGPRGPEEGGGHAGLVAGAAAGAVGAGLAAHALAQHRGGPGPEARPGAPGPQAMHGGPGGFPAPAGAPGFHAPAAAPGFHAPAAAPGFHAPAAAPGFHAPAGGPGFHPQGAARPEAHPQAAPRPQFHPQSAPRPQFHPQAAPRPQFHPQAAPRPQFHPQAAPRPQFRPQAAPRPQFHPQPAPRPQFHPAPAPRPVARPAPRPAGGHEPPHH